MVTKPKQITFTQQEIELLAGPIVYVMYSDTDCLYVGMSINGLSRPFDPQHMQRDVLTSVTNKLIVYQCSSQEEAKQFEYELIFELRPKFNKVITARYSTYKKLNPIT